MRTVLSRAQFSFLVLVLAGACGDDPAPGGPKPGDMVDTNGDGTLDGTYVDIDYDGKADGVDITGDNIPEYDLNGAPWVSGGGVDSGTSQQQDSGTASQCITVAPGYSGVLCTLPTGGQGFQLCTNNVPTGSCLDPSSLLGGGDDGGAGSCFQLQPGLSIAPCSTSTFKRCEGGEPVGECLTQQELINQAFGDAGLPVTGAAKPCPSALTCGNPQILGSSIPGPKMCLDAPVIPGLLQTPPTCTMGGQPCTEGGLEGTCNDLMGYMICVQLCP